MFTLSPSSGIPAPATHHGMVGFDICGFGRRPGALHPFLRDALYRIVTAGLTGTGLAQGAWHQEDRGDGVLVVTPAAISVELLLGQLTDRIRLALRHHNRTAAETARLRLRMAVTAGYLRRDDAGVSGDALIHLFRLLDAAEFKAAMDGQAADLGVITSDDLHRLLIHDGTGIVDPAAYTPIEISNKETTGPAWISLYPVPRPLDERGRHVWAGLSGP